MNDLPKWLSPAQKDGDDPKNWKACNRPLSPAELMYAYRIHRLKDEDEDLQAA